MEDLTPDQIASIANSYRNVARALNELQTRHWPELAFDQQLDINAYQSSLLNRAHDLQSQAVRPAFAQPADIANTIRQATDDACSGLLRIQNLAVAINVGAITVALASSVARANIRGIHTALREMSNLLLLKEQKKV